MRRRLILLMATAVTAFGLMGFSAAPASASSCYIGDPGVDDVYCLVFNEPAVRALCVKLPVC